MNDHNNSKVILNATGNALYPSIKAPCPDWRQVLEKVKANKNRAGMLAKEFINQVEKNFREQHSPLFYAAKLNITKSYLRKICKKTIGLSPSDCIYARLMLEACILLKDEDRTIKEIAFILGFRASSHFSRFFKVQSGMSPDGYKILHLNSG